MSPVTGRAFWKQTLSMVYGFTYVLEIKDQHLKSGREYELAKGEDAAWCRLNKSLANPTGSSETYKQAITDFMWWAKMARSLFLCRNPWEGWIEESLSLCEMVLVLGQHSFGISHFFKSCKENGLMVLIYSSVS